MKIAFILPGKLPVPAVQGGAIESLLNNLLDTNERVGSFKAIVFSEYHKDAERLSKGFIHTKFFFIKRGILFHSLNLLFRLIRKLSGNRTSYLDIYLIVRIIKRKKPDKIIIEGSFLKLLELRKFFSKDQLVFRLHADLIREKSPENLRVLNSASLFIVASDFLRKRIQQNSENLNPRIRILRNGIRKEFYSMADEVHKKAILNKYLISGSAPVVLYVGRIVESKGIMHLLKSLIKSRERISLHFIIMGSFGSGFGIGDKEDNFCAMVKELIQENNDWITITGFVQNVDLPSYYQIADVMVVPSICEDVSPLVVNEAMASGTPLIVTDAGGITEYVNSECAVVIKRDERLVENLSTAICDLLRDPQKLSAMQDAARRNSQHYTLDEFYRSFYSILIDHINPISERKNS
jgi:spore coat protein SA